MEREHLDALQRMRTLESYYRWVLEEVRPWVGRRVLDAGCGTGNFLEQVEPEVDLAYGIDLSPQNLEVAWERFADRPHVTIEQADLDADGRRLADLDFDTVVNLDVIEHIDDDAGMLRMLFDVVRPGGHLLLKTPAHPWLFGSVDEASDHRRRYTKRRLRDLAHATGWEILRLRYMNFAGVAPYFLKSRILKRRANLSRTFSPRELRTIRRAMPLVRTLDRAASAFTAFNGPPVGQSVVLVARRPA
jgi:SAM-dependent methyltransferase